MINLRHVGIIVRDIEKAYTLYRDVFGFEPKQDQVEQGDFYEHLTGLKSGIARTSKCYSKDGTCVELIEYQTQDPVDRHKDLTSDGVNHICLNIDDVDAMYEKLLSMGLEFINPPRINPTGLVKVAFCRDFEGNLIELTQTLS